MPSSRLLFTMIFGLALFLMGFLVKPKSG